MDSKSKDSKPPLQPNSRSKQIFVKNSRRDPFSSLLRGSRSKRDISPGDILPVPQRDSPFSDISQHSSSASRSRDAVSSRSKSSQDMTVRDNSQHDTSSRDNSQHDTSSRDKSQHDNSSHHKSRHENSSHHKSHHDSLTRHNSHRGSFSRQSSHNDNSSRDNSHYDSSSSHRKSRRDIYFGVNSKSGVSSLKDNYQPHKTSGDSLDDNQKHDYEQLHYVTLPRTERTKERSTTSKDDRNGRGSLTLNQPIPINHNKSPISRYEMKALMDISGLDEKTILEYFEMFCSLTDGQPNKGMNSKQFFCFYKRAFPQSKDPQLLSNSVFRHICKRSRTVHFKGFLANICPGTVRIPTLSKFRALFQIWDFNRAGYLTPGSLTEIMRDFYDILGLLGKRDSHRDAMDLFVKMDKKGKCRVREPEFVDTLLSDRALVNLVESCNFCLPSPPTTDICFRKGTFRDSLDKENSIKASNSSVSREIRRENGKSILK